MLVKYLGASYDNKSNSFIPRREFLENGLFRMTQPKFLNDKSEAKFYPYIDKFSTADIDYARKRHSLSGITSNVSEPSEEFLINFYLKPPGIRYVPENFPTLLGFTDYSTLEEYKSAQKKHILKAVEKFNTYIYEALSSQIGVFSLSENATDKRMWAHYASEGKGLAIIFRENHPFFKEFRLSKVSYDIRDRASISYYDGTFRVDGEPVRKYEYADDLGDLRFSDLLSKDFRKNMELSQKLLFTKTNGWSYEQERRLICPLSMCEEKKGRNIEPNFPEHTPKSISKYFKSYPEVCLKKIPFEAFDSVVFGYDMSKSQINETIEKINTNPCLKHLELKQADFDIYGKIILKELYLP